MKALMNSNVCKAISVFTVVAFFISCTLSASMAGTLQRGTNAGSIRESIAANLMYGYSEELMRRLIEAALPLVADEDANISYAISELLSRARANHPEPAQGDPCDEAITMFSSGLSWLFLSYIISQIISSGGVNCEESICIGDDCLCVVDDYEESSTPALAGINNLIRLTGELMIVLAALNYLQNCLGTSTTTIAAG